jgi:hypothetical protein
MLVQLLCSPGGKKHFSILSENGSGAIRKHVFRKMLAEEENASDRGTREETRILPSNYTFRLLGMDDVDRRPSYVLEVTPKNKSKYLIKGRIWVDASDYAITRIEGSPAKNPSFWTRSVHFVHTYKKVGSSWLAASTWSVTKVLIFGTAQLWIRDFDYAPISTPASTDSDAEARLTR